MQRSVLKPKFLFEVQTLVHSDFGVVSISVVWEFGHTLYVCTYNILFLIKIIEKSSQSFIRHLCSYEIADVV